MSDWLIVSTLFLCFLSMCGLAWYQTVKARQYKTAYLRLKRTVRVKRADLIEMINTERVRHKVSSCTCARYALLELRQTIVSEILTPLINDLPE